MLLKATIERDEKNRKIDSLINSSPKKATLYNQFFHTTSFAGITLDYFPIGFTPKKNKRTYDRVTLMGDTFTRGFVEHDHYGKRSMEVRYHANGNPGIVKIFDKNNLIYYAEFSEHSSRPNEVSAFSKNYKYEVKYSNWNQEVKKRAFVYPDYKNTSHIYYELPD